MCCKPPSGDVPCGEPASKGPGDATGATPPQAGVHAEYGCAPKLMERCKICGVSPGDLPSASYLAQLRNGS
jgi:hypothetical protein